MLNFTSILSDVPAFGHVFRVGGRSSSDATQFSVSFGCGTENTDVALKFLVNFAEAQIKRSSYVNGSWSTPESSENLTSQVITPNPLAAGEEFQIYFLLGETKFHVSIDDAAFCEYAYKVPVKDIKEITVSGHIEAVTQADHRTVFPAIYPLVSVDDNHDVIYSGLIPKKYGPGHIVVISGVPTGNVDGEFAVMFNQNDCPRQLIHFNVRFYDDSVYMNSMNDDSYESWSDKEVVSENFPFAINQIFKVAFAFTETEVKVAVGGHHLMSFAFDRIDLEEDQSIWSMLNGFQMNSLNDSYVTVSKVDHVKSSLNCEGYEALTNQ